MSPAWWELFVVIGGGLAAMVVVLITYAVIMLGLARMRGGGWGGLVAVGLLLSCVAGGTWLSWQLGDRPDDPGTGFIIFVLCFMLIGPFAFGACTWLLPARRRRGGARRGGRGLAAAFFAGAILCLATLIGVLAIPAYSGGAVGASELGPLVAPLLALTAGLAVAGARMRRQRRAASATALAADDRRPPVLYLREFRHERQPFVSGDAESLKPYLQNAVRWIPTWLQPSWVGVQTVSAEEYLAEAMGAQIGPFLALGSPLDELPALGAARDYADDANWQTRLLDLARAARAIVLVPGTSDALSWELRTLRDAGMAAKLFVLVGSDTFQSSSLWLVGRLYGWRNPDWPLFRGLLQATGYSVPPHAPRPHSVLGFDSAGRGVWLAEGTALVPELYAATMTEHLQTAEVSVAMTPKRDAAYAEPSSPAPPPTTAQAMDDIVSGRNTYFELRLLGAIVMLTLPVKICIDETLSGDGFKFGFQASIAEFAAISAAAGCLSFLMVAPKGTRLAAVLTGVLAGTGSYAAAVLLGDIAQLRYELMFFLVVLGAAPGISAMFWWVIRSMDDDVPKP